MVFSDEVMVPGNAVPIVIGAQGANIRKLQEDFHVKLMFLGLNTETYELRPLRIIGTPREVEAAKRRINEISAGRDLEFFAPPPSAAAAPASPASANGGSGGVTSSRAQNDGTVRGEFLVPTSVAPRVIGRNSENLANIAASQNLRSLDAEGIRVTDDGREVRQLVLHGSAEGVANARILLEQLANDFIAKDFNANGAAAAHKKETTYDNITRSSALGDSFWDDDGFDTTRPPPPVVGVAAAAPTSRRLNGGGGARLAHSASSDSDADFTTGGAAAANTAPLNVLPPVNLSAAFQQQGGGARAAAANAHSAFTNGVSATASLTNGVSGGGALEVQEAEIIPLSDSPVKFNINTPNGLPGVADGDLKKFASHMASLAEQSERDTRRVYACLRDASVKAALDFVAGAEYKSQRELRALRDKLALAEAECAAARSAANAGSGLYSVQIAELKKQLRLKDSQLDSLLMENEQFKSNLEDLTLEMARVKSEQQKAASSPPAAAVTTAAAPAAFSPREICKQCGVKPRDTILMPCLHLSHCKTCANALATCVICNAKVSSRLLVKVEAKAAAVAGGGSTAPVL